MNSTKFNYFLVERDSFVDQALNHAEQLADHAFVAINALKARGERCQSVLALCIPTGVNLVSYLQLPPPALCACYYATTPPTQDSWLSMAELAKRGEAKPQSDQNKTLLTQLYTPRCEDCGGFDHEFNDEIDRLEAALKCSAAEIIGKHDRYRGQSAAKQAQIFAAAVAKGTITAEPFKVFGDWVYRMPIAAAIDPPQSRQLFPLELKTLTCDLPVEDFKSEQTRLLPHIVSQFKAIQLAP